MLNIYIRILIYVFIVTAINYGCAYSKDHDKVAKFWSRINLPDDQLPYFFNNNKKLKKKCEKDENCPYKQHLNTTKCYGYEKNCNENNRIFLPECPEDSNGWVNTKSEQIKTFWNQADFGYIKERLSEMKTFCKPTEPGDSSLECVKYTRMCRAKNIYFDMKNIKTKGSYDRYREDLFTEGEVGGHCKFDSAAFKKEGEHKSPLQSWYSELQTFKEFDFKPIDDKKCDVVIERPTYLIKLDAGINMYHHFCDFINLYMSQHINNSFSQNINIFFWDTSEADFWSYFSDTWSVFSNFKPLYLRDYDGKRVCFRDAVFSLLARMRYGHFYNMPLIRGCYKTSMYQAFSQHVLHRLKIEQNGPVKDKVRVTFLARGTKFRNVLNEADIVKALKSRLKKDIELNVVDYNAKMPFKDQLKQTYNSDILMSMHGAGLTHLLFLPDWAAVFEIYNCEDQDCYQDLARLRGVKYYTWEKSDKVYPQDEGKHPQLGTPHKKFTNYSFDVDEFVRMVRKMVKYVQSHPKFIESQQKLYGKAEVKTEL